MPPSFENKLILVTGGGSGIGRATAIKLASLGGTCALQDVNSKTLKETESLCSTSQSQVHFSSAFDVSVTERVNGFVDEVMAKYGRIDYVFNCAGINPTSLKTEEIDDMYYDKIMGVNLKHVQHHTRRDPTPKVRRFIRERGVDIRPWWNSRYGSVLRK
ncbi:(6R)-2,2,6-trimethyl-1,4-cyclohexanedione reductase [Hyphodiscus hymeniophilus]|uniref:(6R)-2,2,6-trimethyl-1,4-cyclohexanedione reductase n=1 Tax=Hyphodiscus hymeniophilus TaxID=353542 RepID=A0A9P6VGP6_9HELO|nr:(6R)-2,2,6-trimethyl-1,4-cyclohexanedione reductase [Hyphodiscus hymeniophilus]